MRERKGEEVEMASFRRCRGECRLGGGARVEGHLSSVYSAQSALWKTETVGAH